MNADNRRPEMGLSAFLLVFVLLGVLHVAAEFDSGFAGVLVVVAKIDYIARAVIRAALAAQGFRVHRQQVLLRVAQADVLIVGGGFHVVQRKLGGHALGIH